MDAETFSQYINALNSAIADYTGEEVVDVVAAEAQIPGLLRELGDAARYAELTEFEGDADYSGHCNVLISLYEIVLEKDEETASNLLRYMFTP